MPEILFRLLFLTVSHMQHENEIAVSQRLNVVLAAPCPAKPNGPTEMPWIWRTLRAGVYDRLPTYRNQRQFAITLAPVAVRSTDDTVAGVGVEGEF